MQAKHPAVDGTSKSPQVVCSLEALNRREPRLSARSRRYAAARTVSRLGRRSWRDAEAHLASCVRAQSRNEGALIRKTPNHLAAPTTCFLLNFYTATQPTAGATQNEKPITWWAATTTNVGASKPRTPAEVVQAAEIHSTTFLPAQATPVE